MKAMILAAGQGKRLRPITNTIPKPLVEVGGKSLILWHIEKLKAIGITDIIVNSAYLSDKIVEFLGDGKKFGISITHSVEDGIGLETAGGIIKALPFFEGEDFLVINGDVFIDADYSQFLKPLDNAKGRLYLVRNPVHNQKGDFSLLDNGICQRGGSYTFSGCALYSTKIFDKMPVQRLALLPVFENLCKEKALQGELLQGQWFDVGTLERLEAVNNYLNK